MLFAILSIIAVLIGIETFRRVFKEDSFGTSLFLGGMAFTLIGLIFVLVPARTVAYFTADRVDVQFSIVSMGDANGTKGRLYGGWGSIESGPVFMYYVKIDGYYRLRNVAADRVRIVESDDTFPHYERRCRDYSTVPEWLRMKWPHQYDNYTEYGCDNNTDTYTFYVPVGSIQQTFNLDAS